MKCRNISMLCFVFIFMFSVDLGAQEKKTKADNEAKKEKGQFDEGKKYSLNEFRQEVLKEVEIQLKKLGRDKLVDFSKQLLNKEEKIRLAELELVREREKLELTIQEFQKQIAQFKDQQSNFLGCIDKIDVENNNRINHMVEVITGMRPNNAADILAVQDPEITVKILGLLDPSTVSKIFNLMDKEISARLQKQYMNMKK